MVFAKLLSGAEILAAFLSFEKEDHHMWYEVKNTGSAAFGCMSSFWWIIDMGTAIKLIDWARKFSMNGYCFD